MVRQPVAPQPCQGRFQFDQGHLGATPVAEDALQHRVVAVVETLSGARHLQPGFVLDRLMSCLEMRFRTI